MGWSIVTRKGEFSEGSLCVFCEIDSILPEKPEFEFLRKNHFRIKTARLRGQISQGIAFPLNIIADKLKEGIYDVEIGQDVTELLGVTQWQPKIPACLAGTVKGKFPSFLPKTDESRIQILVDVLKRFIGTKCYFSEKIDGSSCSVFLNTCPTCGSSGSVEITGEVCKECKGTGKVFGVCSRNLELYETEGNAFWKVVRELKIEEKLRSLNRNICLQGELCGNGIQNNNLGIIGTKILFFNVFDIDRYLYLDFKDFVAFYKDIDVETVPILCTDFTLINDVEELVKLATAKSVINKDIWREGIVIRPLKEIVDLGMSNSFNNGRLSFKVINTEYLLKYE